MGRMRISDITATDIRRVLSHVQGKGLAPATVNNVLKVITNVLTFAQENGYVERNVARDLPRKHRPGDKRVTEPRYLTREEVDQLLAHAPDNYRPVWACCVYAGLRI